MKKKIVLGIFVVITLFFITGCGSKETTLKDNLNDAYNSLSSKEKKSVDYNELSEDVESLGTNQTLKYAKYDSDSRKYVGNGYYVEEMPGGEVVTYVFYTTLKDNKFYVVNVFYPLSEG